MRLTERLDQRLLIYLDERYGYLKEDPRKARKAPEGSELQKMDQLQVLTGLAHPPRTMPRTAVPYKTDRMPGGDRVVLRSIGTLLVTVRQSRKGLQGELKESQADPDPFARDPSKHPGYQKLPWSVRAAYSLIGGLRVAAHYLVVQTRQNPWFSRWAPVVLILAGTVLSVSPMNSAEKPWGRERIRPAPQWTDSIRHEAKIKTLKTLHTIKSHVPARPPIGDSKRKLTSEYGRRQDPINKDVEFHGGVDFGASLGTPVRAPGSGRVIDTGHTNRAGKYVKIRHGPLPYITTLAHLGTIDVKQGTKVSALDTIGTVGMSGRATGPHVHFRIRKKKGGVVNPADIYQAYVAAKDSFRKAKKKAIQVLRKARANTGKLRSKRDRQKMAGLQMVEGALDSLLSNRREKE